MTRPRMNPGPSAAHATRLFQIGKRVCAVCTLMTLWLLPGGCAKGGSGAVQDIASVSDTQAAPADTVPEERPDPVMRFDNPEEIKAYMASSPSAARYRMGILPAMADDAPEYAEKLLNSKYPRFVIADKGSMRVIVYDSLGVELRSFKMAAGKNYGTKHKRRDCRTPEGFFSVEGVYNSTDWLYTDDDGNVSQVKGQFGPRFIRLLIPTTRQIGIHGTCAPWSVGGRRSHGCMRLKNEDILELVTMVDSGMPVIVNPSWKDMQVNEREGSRVVRVQTGYADITRPKPAPDAVATPEADSVHEPRPDTLRAPEEQPRPEEAPAAEAGDTLR